jgi:hypothetical protein
MGKINFGRVLLGGLVAGVILNIGEFILNDFIVKAQMEAIFRRSNISPPGTNFLVIAVVLTFLLGIVLVYAYALIRSRLRPGPKTAVITALIVWFAAYVYSGSINAALFGFPTNVLLIALAWGALEYIVATLVGAWLYKEV